MLTAVLDVDGLSYNERELSAFFGANYGKLLRKMTLVHVAKVGAPKSLALYARPGNGRIYLPREYIRIMTKISRLVIVHPPLVRIPELPAPELYPNQKIIVDYLAANSFSADKIAAGIGSAILDLKAGMGKTFVAAGLIARLALRTLVIVPRKLLATQFVADLSSYFGLERVRLYSDGPADINVIVINSALKLGRSELAGYSMLVLDEVHTYCTEQRMRALRFTLPVVFGMSGTVGDREDGFDAAATRHVAVGGIIKATDIPDYYEDDSAFDCKVVVLYYRGPATMTINLRHESTGEIFTHYMYEQFSSDPHRSELILYCLHQLLDWAGPDGQRHNIYVFAEEEQILRLLYEKFGSAESAMFTGKSTKQELECAKTDARVLFATYAYANTGISFPRMTAMILATPRKAATKQTIARILRRGSDPVIPRIVVDIVDSGTCLKAQLAKRMEAYELYGYSVSQEFIKYNSDNKPSIC